MQSVQFGSGPYPGVPIALTLPPIHENIHLIVPLKFCKLRLRILSISLLHGYSPLWSLISFQKSLQQIRREVKKMKSRGLSVTNHFPNGGSLGSYAASSTTCADGPG